MVRVVGLVGPSGTGKSHRASFLAVKHACDVIIDDGLLIQEGKILAGTSAKRARSKIEAIRRAIFAHPPHAREVQAALEAAAPDAVLVLGTSKTMVAKICDTLGLPPPALWVDIAQVADPTEIKMARKLRQRYGRHVIPAPTVEVRKTFSGYLVDPLHYILRTDQGRKADVVMEKSVVRPTWSTLGRFTVDDTVVAAIAGRAAMAVPEIAQVRRVLIENWQNGVTVHLEVVVYFGAFIPGILKEARRQVIQMVEHMTALNVLRAVVVARRVIPRSGLRPQGVLSGGRPNPRE